jgi:3-oxoacyl-[acyl-carrier protein] reductase
MRLNGKVAIVTGGARGIGRETAIMFAEHGARTVICDLDEEQGTVTLAELQAIDQDCLYFKIDVTKRESIDNMVAKIIKQLGTIDILVNNAGVTQDALLAKMSESQWDTVLNINLKGVYNCTQAVLPVMLQQKKGKIINITSVVALYGNIGQSNYAAAKAGVIGLTKTWAKELGRKGINVNAVAPGYTMTDMMTSVPQKVLTMISEKNPLGRLGQPKDVAYANLFLASDEADYVNGAILSVDGGMTI